MTGSTTLRHGTYEAFDSEALSRVHDYLVARDPSEMPTEVHETLLKVVDALQHGVAVSAASTSRMVTTQEAAALLNVSRPTVVKLLEGAKIPFEMAGTHRRLHLADVMAYRDARRREQHAALLALESLGTDDPADFVETLDSLREARKAIRRARVSQE